MNRKNIVKIHWNAMSINTKKTTQKKMCTQEIKRKLLEIAAVAVVVVVVVVAVAVFVAVVINMSETVGERGKERKAVNTFLNKI